jgi:Protein of unknown function (DUF2397)
LSTSFSLPRTPASQACRSTVASAARGYLAERLSGDTVAGLLAADEFHLDKRLEQLERWQVVTRWQEPARTGEDFLRRRDRYQLTLLAARLHAFWSQAEDADEEEAGDLTLAPCRRAHL